MGTTKERHRIPSEMEIIGVCTWTLYPLPQIMCCPPSLCTFKNMGVKSCSKVEHIIVAGVSIDHLIENNKFSVSAGKKLVP
jgi:hypothetical protein